MSRQQKRADERKRHKTGFQKICLAAGEGVGRAVAFSFALASNAFAAEPKKEETFDLPPVVVQDQNSPYVVPHPRYQNFPSRSKTHRNRSLSCRKNSSKNRLAQPCAMPCATSRASPPPRAKAAAHKVTFLPYAGSTRATICLSMACATPAPIFVILSISMPSKSLKGPSSTFFGRGSTGGIINQVSKVPRLDPSYNGIFSGGAGPLCRGTVDVNQPLSQVLPNAALRINLMAHGDDVVGRDKIELRRQGFAPSIAFGLGTPTQITLSYLLQHEDNIPDYGFPYINGAPLRTDRDTFYGLTKEDHEKTLVNVGTLRLDHRFNDIFNLRNTLRYSHVDRDSAVTNATVVLPNTITRSRPQRDTQESILSNQTDLTAKFDTFGFKHTATTGLEVSRETFDLVRWASTGPNTTINNPNNNALPNPKVLAADSDTRAIGFGYLCRGSDQVESIFRHRRRRPLGLLRYRRQG